MIGRRLASSVAESLDQFPAVVLLGPRQVGKTTLARSIADARGARYLDLERPRDRAVLDDPERYLDGAGSDLLVLDEVHRVPDLFPVLRAVIDDRRRAGARNGQFLLLGSAGIDLLTRSGETLAGRAAYVELAPLDVREIDSSAGSGADAVDRLWLRGGFPDSFLARSGRESAAWRRAFIRTYLERDIPAFGSRVPAETLRRFWTMLAHRQGTRVNASELARSMSIGSTSVARYIDLLVDLLLVRRLEPFHANVGKRLVKSPKVYVRDSGLVHSLLGIETRDALFGHPVVGGSWEGFVIEQAIAAAPDGTVAMWYRTAAGAEIDLLLELPGGARWAIEIKSGVVPKVTRGFHTACEDVDPDRAIIVTGDSGPPYARGDATVMGVVDLVAELDAIGGD